MTLFELMSKITFDSSDFDKGVDSAKSKASELASKIGSGLKIAAKIGTAAIGAAATGIAALTKASVENYAEYEQLVGGAQLMFGKGFETVQKNAQNAYKTVQMSQSEYLQQVNGFATGLKTALNGDEQAAAELSHRIIKAEADIIAATGNTAENVQNAFNGIMKSNFTMLDNLQIGIKPTKEGFQEVIDKVNEWKKSNGEATNYQMGNLADMQSALVDYIEMVGMSDYATNEASKTISGSLASMKSAWSNLVTGIADDEADFDTLIDNFVESVGTAAENIIPRIEVALNGIGELIEKLIPIVAEKLPGIIEGVLPSLISASTSLIDGIVSAIPTLLQVILNEFPGIMSSLSETLISLLPELLLVGAHALTSIVDGLTEALPTFFECVSKIIPEIVQIFQDNFPELIVSGVLLLVNLITGIAQALPTLIPAIMDVIDTLVTTLTDPWALTQILDAALLLLTELAFGLIDAIPQLVDTAITVIENLVLFILDPDNLAKIINAALKIVIALGTGLINAIPELISSVLELIENIRTQFKETDWGEVGKNIIDGLLDGLKKAWESIKTWFSNAWNSLFGNNEVNVDVNTQTRHNTNGSHYSGLSYVPFDGYIAELHKGERVLTANENAAYNEGLRSINVYNTFNGDYTERDSAKIVRSINRKLGALV